MAYPPSLHRNPDQRNGLGVAGAGKRDINLDSSQPIMEREYSIKTSCDHLKMSVIDDQSVKCIVKDKGRPYNLIYSFRKFIKKITKCPHTIIALSNH